MSRKAETPNFSESSDRTGSGKLQNMSGRPTIEDLARELGLSYSAVAAALRGDRRTSARTTERVLELAARRGYVRNAAASALASRRSETGERPFALALLGGSPGIRPSLNSRYADALRTEAERLGYSFEAIPIDEYPSFARLKQVLLARNVAGAIINTHRKEFGVLLEGTLDLPIVKLHHHLPGYPGLTVSVDEFATIHAAASRALDRGYRRIGLVYWDTRPASPEHQSVMTGALLAAYREHHQPLDFDPLVPAPFDFPKRVHAQVAEEVSRRGLDCLISQILNGWTFLDLGFERPVGLAFISGAGRREEATGYRDVEAQLAQHAIRLLDGAVRHKTELRQGDQLLVRPEWYEGRTLPPP